MTSLLPRLTGDRHRGTHLSWQQRLRPISPVARWRAVAGLVGPVVFTGAWVSCGRRQEGVGNYAFRSEHISGLAAPDAAAPTRMTAGFLLLGVSLWPFATELRRTLGSSAGIAPVLLRIGGVAIATAAVFRRDRMLLGPPPDEPDWVQSRRNDVHDMAAAVANGCALVAPLALAYTVRVDQRWRSLKPVAMGIAACNAFVLALFGSGLFDAYGGVLQRLSATLSLGGVAALAATLLRHGRAHS